MAAEGVEKLKGKPGGYVWEYLPVTDVTAKSLRESSFYSLRYTKDHIVM